MLALCIGFVVVICVALPLRFVAARGLAVPGAGRMSVYFAGLGLGFMAVEIALLQKFGLFLGHPNYALSVVLIALLASTGLGAALAERLPPGKTTLQWTGLALALAIAVEWALVLPHLQAASGWAWGLKALAVAVLITPIGIGLGVFFPFALRQLKQSAPVYVPWAWGVNGIFSVLGPVVALGVSVSHGNSVLLAAAILIYLAAVLCWPADGATNAKPE